EAPYGCARVGDRVVPAHARETARAVSHPDRADPPRRRARDREPRGGPRRAPSRHLFVVRGDLPAADGQAAILLDDVSDASVHAGAASPRSEAHRYRKGRHEVEARSRSAPHRTERSERIFQGDREGRCVETHGEVEAHHETTEGMMASL